MMVEGVFKSDGDLFEIVHDVGRRMRVHHGRHEGTLTHSPLRHAHGLHSVDEYLTRSAAREAHKSEREVPVERTVVPRDLASDEVLQYVGPPFADHTGT